MRHYGPLAPHGMWGRTELPMVEQWPSLALSMLAYSYACVRVAAEVRSTIEMSALLLLLLLLPPSPNAVRYMADHAARGG